MQPIRRENPATRSVHSSPHRWDIFCNVVDNFGDIGVCWRLARQLAAEHALAVRLWVDDLASFRRINSSIDPNLQEQMSHGVTIRRWSKPFGAVEPAEVVIETFGCEVPYAYAAAMADRATKPAWINLEYLSAEAWVTGCHALPSPHPRLPLTRYFFFPGFDKDGRNAARNSFGDVHVAGVDAEGRKVLNRGRAKQVTSHLGDHAHGSATEAGGHSLICTLPAEAQVEFLSKNRLARPRKHVVKGDEVDVGTAYDNNVGLFCHQCSLDPNRLGTRN